MREGIEKGEEGRVGDEDGGMRNIGRSFLEKFKLFQKTQSSKPLIRNVAIVIDIGDEREQEL